MNPVSEETMVFNILPSKTADNDNYRPLGSTNRKWPPTHCFQQRLIIIPAVSKTASKTVFSCFQLQSTTPLFPKNTHSPPHSIRIYEDVSHSDSLQIVIVIYRQNTCSKVFSGIEYLLNICEAFLDICWIFGNEAKHSSSKIFSGIFQSILVGFFQQDALEWRWWSFSFVLAIVFRDRSLIW